jgi:hypothetical protein
MDAAGISGKEAVERMPPRFSFVEEGRVYFELISRWAMLFMQVTVRAMADAQKAWWDTTSVTAVEDNPVQSWAKAVMPFGQEASSTQACYYQASQMKYAEELGRWNRTFRHLYKRIQQKKR